MLDHPGELSHECQHDTLIRSAAAASHLTLPYYVFYNGWGSGWPSSAAWLARPNGRGPGACGHFTVADYGCSVTPAHVVQTLHSTLGRSRKHVDQYLSSSLPWSCLFGVTPCRGDSAALPVVRGASSHLPVTTRLVALHRALAAIRPNDGLVDSSQSWLQAVGQPDAPSNVPEGHGDKPLAPSLLAYARLVRQTEVVPGPRQNGVANDNQGWGDRATGDKQAPSGADPGLPRAEVPAAGGVVVVDHLGDVEQ